MVQPVVSVDWERIGRQIRERGCNFRMDEKPMPTGSGYLNKYWFNFLWFGGCNAILSIALPSLPEMSSSWRVLVDVLSDNIFEGKYPVWRFSRTSEIKGIVNFQWYPLDLLEEKLKDLLGDTEIKSVYTLDGKRLKMMYQFEDFDSEGIKLRLEKAGYTFSWLPNPERVPGIHGEINGLNFGFFYEPGVYGLFLINLPANPGKDEIPWAPILEEFEKIVGSKPNFQYQDKKIKPTALYWEWNISGKEEDRLAFLAKTSGIYKLQKYST